MVDLESTDAAVSLTCVHLLPEQIPEFCARFEEVLVLEEGTAFVEDEVQRLVGRHGLSCHVLGQRSSTVPPLGVTSADDLAAALRGAPVARPALNPRPADVGLDSAEYRTLFQALSDLHRESDVAVHSCVGSCISISYPPYSAARSALNLGGATGVAVGAALADGRRCIALIGDYGLIHSGLDAHDQAYRRHLPVLTIILANGRSAKTGNQPSALFRSVSDQDPIDVPSLVGPRPTGSVSLVHVERVGVAELRRMIEDMLDVVPSTLVVMAGEDASEF